MLRNIQGLHAPLKLQMELRAVKQVGFFYLTDITYKYWRSFYLGRCLCVLKYNHFVSKRGFNVTAFV